MVKVNGTELNIAGKTVAEYLAGTNYDRKRIAVERNGDIVPKAQYETVVLADGDSVEVVSFVGGGWKNGAIEPPITHNSSIIHCFLLGFTSFSFIFVHPFLLLPFSFC